MNKLRPGVCLVHKGEALELISQAEEDETSESWWCELLFVDQAAQVLRSFRKGEHFRAIHGTLSYSA